MKKLVLASTFAALALTPTAALAQRERSAPSVSEIVVTKATDVASPSLFAKKPNAEMNIVLADGTELKGIAAFVETGLFKPARSGANGTGKTMSAEVLGKGKKVKIDFVKTDSAGAAALLRAAKTNQKLKSLTLMLAPRSKQEPYYTVKLENVLVSSWSTSGSDGSRPTESLSINFTKIEFRNTPSDDKH